MDALERVEGGAIARLEIQLLREFPRPRRVGLGDGRHDEDVPHVNFRRQHALHLDDVIAEGGLHRPGDHPGFERERRLLKLRSQRRAAPQPAEVAALLGGTGVLGEPSGCRREIGAIQQRHLDRIRQRERLGLRRGIGLRRHHDLLEGDGGRTLAELALLFLVELPHLLFGRRDFLDLVPLTK